MEKEEKRIYACWLACVPGIGNRTIDKLLTLCRNEKDVYCAGEKVWKEVLTERQLVQMKDFAVREEPECLYRRIRQDGIRFIMRGDEEYPERLERIPDPPYALYVKGRLPVDDKPSVAVVGARDCSEYGSFVATGIGEMLGQNDIQVISGMARGIDGISQRAALQVGGSSYGVLGCGVDVCYPPSNRELYEDLCELGGVMSAYPPGTEARPGNFPPRNRIVSGLCDVLIVVEARAKSGTLITVDMALEQGKDVYVVPGRITDRLSDGCNKLVKQGAEVFLTPEDFIDELWERWSCNPVGNEGSEALKQEDGKKRIRESNSGKSGKLLQWRPVNGVEGLSKERKAVYEVLDFDPVTPEQIQEKLEVKYPLPKLMSMLIGLCTEGLVQQISPGYFVRRGD